MNLSRLAVCVLFAIALPIWSIEPPEPIPSAECMSCHGSGSAPVMRAEVSHPAGVSYVAGRSPKRGVLRAPHEPSGLGSTVAADMLVDGRVECTSCHVSHDRKGGAFALRIGEEWQRDTITLCRACHVID